MAPLPPSSDWCAYAPLNATSNCFVPRSCADCLHQPGCMIGRSGRCESWQNIATDHVYTRAIALNLTLPTAKDTVNREPQEWEFPALTTTYCAATDATCQQCVDQKFWASDTSPGTTDSRFCVGTDGCVCVFNCEISATPLSPTCTDLGDSGSGAGSTAIAAEAVVAPDPSLPKSPSGNASASQCRYANTNAMTGCRQLRSCRECLDIQGCYISVDGYCTSSDNFDSRLHFRSAFNASLVLPVAKILNASGLMGEQEWFFPATELRYCDVNDSVCAQCIRERYWLSAGAPDDSRFCVGSHGCVCIANCARDEHETRCPSATPSPDEMENSGAYITRALTWMAVAAFTFVALMMVLIMLCCYYSNRTARVPKDSVPIAHVVVEATPVAPSTIEQPTRHSIYLLLEPTTAVVTTSPRTQL